MRLSAFHVISRRFVGVRKIFGVYPGQVLEMSGVALVGVAGMAASLSIRGFFGFNLRILPLWSWAVAASIGGVLFFLGPMLFGMPQFSSRGAAGMTPSSKLLLYLRPFDHDQHGVLQLLVGAMMGPVLYVTVLCWQWWIVCLPWLGVKITDEQKLQRAFGAFGHLLAFRQPGRRLDPIGALRHRAEGDWKKELIDLLAVSSVVIIRPGETESIRWEISEVLRAVPLERIIFHLRFSGGTAKRQRAYEAFRAQLQAVMPVDLPERIGRARYLLITRDRGPYFFAPGNRPADLLRQVLSGDMARERLRPLFAALGEEFKVEPLTFQQKIDNLILLHSPVVSAAVFAVMGVLVGVLGKVLP